MIRIGQQLRLYDFGGGFAGGGGATKTNQSISETKDNSATAGGDNYGGGEDNTIVVNSDAVALESLKTVKDFLTQGAGGVLAARELDADIAKTFAQLNYSQSRDTTAALEKLAETKITDGANLNQKTTMVALAIGGAVLLFSALKRR